MTTYNLIINKFAENDIDVSYKYYEMQRGGLGDDFLVELKSIFEKVSQNPYLFSIIEKNAQKANLTKFPFAVFYIVQNEQITVFSVFHFSRKPEIWKSRNTDND